MPIRSALFLSLTLAACLVPGCAEQPSYRTVATTEELMHGMVEPLSTLVFESVQTIVDLEGVHEIQPQTDDEWELVQDTALSLAEAANLLQFPDREFGDAVDERGEDWDTSVNGLIDASLQAAEAARARDPRALFTAGSAIYEDGCLACHEAYLPENAEGPEGPQP